jgi:phosphopantetheinyl transferase
MTEYILSGEALDGRSGHEAGRALLERMYQEKFGQPMPRILKGKDGKPYFSGHPVYFSISHTRRHVFCALSSRSIGIDAEELDRPVKPQLARHILSAHELEQYRKAEDPQRALLTFWVLKEAAGKCTGQGVQGYPKHTKFFLSNFY